MWCVPSDFQMIQDVGLSYYKSQSKYIFSPVNFSGWKDTGMMGQWKNIQI